MKQNTHPDYHFITVTMTDGTTYPHKTAYRHLSPPVSMAQAWSTESKDALAIYVHLPMCEMRCGYCNLFTLAQPQEEFVDSYLRNLHIEAGQASQALGPATFTQLAWSGLNSRPDLAVSQSLRTTTTPGAWPLRKCQSTKMPALRAFPEARRAPDFVLYAGKTRTTRNGMDMFPFAGLVWFAVDIFGLTGRSALPVLVGRSDRSDHFNSPP